MYKNNVRVTLSLEIPARNVPGIQPGDHLANSAQSGYTVVFDGGIDMHRMGAMRTQAEIKRLQAQGKGIVTSSNGRFQYVIRKEV